MPTLTRYYLKTALVYLIAAFELGLLLTARSLIELPPILAGTSPVYFHLFMVGWVTQLIFGIVFWLFPKFSREQPRGREWLGWSTYVLLNAGLLLRAVAEPQNSQRPGEIWGWLLVVSAALQWTAGLLFLLNTWPRVHGGPRRREREA